MKARVETKQVGDKINRHIYGHFSEHLGRCVYGGYWVGYNSDIPNVRGIRTDIVEAMRAIKSPNIRWPGGCFADDYHWMDGIGPQNQRKPIVNVHWGGVLEDNSFGTHEFMDLCGQIGASPYICGNVGSGTVREMRDQIEYLTDNGQSPMANLRRQNGREEAWDIEFFGVGNENWGCGGFMTAEQYSMEFRKFAAYIKNYKYMGKVNWWQAPPILRIAGGHNAERVDWQETLMKSIPSRFLGGLSVHIYVKPGEESHGTQFSPQSWYQTAVNTYAKEQLLKNNISIMDYYDPEKKVLMAVDEWGIWVDNEPGSPPGFLYQQNTMRSAMCAALMLHMFHRYADRVKLANLAQTINVLQAILLTEGNQMIKTPTYHVFDLFQGHQNSNFVPVQWDIPPKKIDMELPQVDISASISGEGKLVITAVNLSAEEEADIELQVGGGGLVSAEGRYIAGPVNAHNTFTEPEIVAVQQLSNVQCDPGKNYIKFRLPPCGIASLDVKMA